METTNKEKNPDSNPEAPDGGEQPVIREDEDEKLLDSNWTETVENFEDLNLKKDLIRGVFGYGFVKPSAIQQKAIKPIIMKKDIIAQAQSGSGKTATFVISMLQNIDHEDLKCQALIIAPTRELAIQIADVVKNLGLYLKISVHLCTGGTQIMEDKKKLKDGVHIVVGTPGRIRDMMNRQILNPTYLKMLIIDEADEMLGLGFLEQINEIIKMIPPDCQICLFSATIPPEIIKLTENIMNDPAKILVKKENLTLEGIKQYYLSCSNDTNKYENLFEIFANIDVNQCIIYVNTKDKAERLSLQMREKEFIVSCIHGSMEQDKRNSVMKEFREGASRILISTDLLARGIDVHQVGLVINFELPPKKENYIHRIGRSGRFGRRGIAINLISVHEANYMIEIQEFYHTHIAQLPNDLAEID
jgi:translation initiation factor 4A